MATVEHPITIRHTTKAAPVASIPASQRGTGADTIPFTKFAANIVLTPLRTFGINFGDKLYRFQVGSPRIVSAPLRAAVIALSNARTDKFVKETA